MMVSPAAPVRVLLVENQRADAHLMREMLAEAGADRIAVVHVERLQQAMTRLRQGGISAVLLDLSLPDSTGLETFNTVHTAAPETPVVVLTGLVDEETAVTAVRQGAQDYLVKGRVDGPLLYNSICRAIDRQHLEDRLRTSEARYRSVLENSIQGILIHADGVVRVANQAFARLMNVEQPSDVIGQSVWSFVAPEDRERVASNARMRLAGGPAPHRYEVRALRRDGGIIWLDCSATNIEWDGETATLVTMVEVTERKKVEKALIDSEEQFRQLAENIKEAFLLVEVPANGVLYVSSVWEEIWGRTIAELQADPQLWFSTIHREDQPLVQAGRHAVERGEASAHVFRVMRPDGTVRWARARLFPVFDNGGRPYRLVGLVEDITDARRTEEQFRQAQRMEAVGRLAGGVAHDFNNLLTAILGYADLVLHDLGPAHLAAGDVREIRNAGESAVRLTRQLLAFSRRQILQPRVIDLNQTLRRMDSLLRRLIGEDVTLKTKLMTPLARVSADPGQIEQVVMNLAVNARDAMPQGGRLTIETGNVELGADYAARHAGASAGPHVMLTVSDTGIGMDEATQKRLFEPFFTTKEPGKGTGLGLAMVYGVVKQSNGSVWVYSEPGLGSTFKVYLPAVVDPGEDYFDVPVPRELGGTETVLVVEDQAEVRAVTRETLRRYGYTVLEVGSGPEALVLSREHRGVIHLLFTDVVMPGLSGRHVARLVAADRPGIRVVYTSGYTDDAVVHHGVLEPGLAFVQKPFTPDALLRKIREVLEAPQPPPV